MRLKRHEDFLNESNLPDYHGYIGKDLAKKLKIGEELIQHSRWNKKDPQFKEEFDVMPVTVLKVDDEALVTVDGIGFNDKYIKMLNNDSSEVYEKFEDDIKITYLDKAAKDEHGFYFEDIYTGGRLYYKFNDEHKNKKVFKSAAKYNIMESIYDDKLTGKVNDLSYLLKQLKELIHDNDSYKANVKKEGDKIIVDHEIPEKKQRLIIKDNDKDNDFFYISGTDENGKAIDDMGEQASEVIFVQISKLFQQL